MSNSVVVGMNKFLVSGLCTGTLALGLVGSAVSSAQAQTFKFEWDRNAANLIETGKCSTCYKDADLPLGINDKAGVHDFIGTTYDTKTEKLSWTSTFSDSMVDGGWLVISDGPNPKKHDKEFAIFYLDGVNNKLSAYAYNGKNNSSSWDKNPFLQSWDDALTFTDDGNGNTSMSFSIDATDLNARQDLGKNWKGAGFDKNIGIWFHAAKVDELEYDYEGALENVDWGKAGWYDTGSMETERVPEPATMLGMLIVGGLGLFGCKRKQS